jgi:hypothetical protein
MKLIIDIPEGLYEAYKGRPPRLGDEGMDMIAQAIANGTPIKTVINAEEAEAYPINQEDKSRILRDIANIKDLPICKECRFCKHCMRNKKLPKITFEKGYPFIYCARHDDHFSPHDTCEFFDKETENE